MIVRPEKKTVLSSRLLFILLIICAAFLSAFLGQVAINLLTTSPSLLPEQRLVIRQAQDAFEQMRELANDIESRESDGFVQFYTQLDNPNASVSQGIVLTSDGWMLAAATPDAVRWQWTRLESGEVLPVTSVVSDPATPLVFVKVGANNLQPVTLADAMDEDTWGPQLALGYARHAQVVIVNDTQLRANTYLSSDQINRYHVLDGGAVGNAFYNSKGEIFGLEARIGDQLVLIDVTAIRTALDQVLRSGKITRPSLGLQYVDLSSRAYSASVTGGLTSGALLTNAIQAPQPTALGFNTLGYKAGLRLQDVIVSVNGSPINHARGLSDLVASAKPKDKMEIGILRAGKPMTISLIVGETSSK